MRRFSSSRPAASPVIPLHRGRSSTVSLCPCEVLLHLLHVAVMLCALLLDHFIHRSHRNTVVDVCFAVVFAVTDNELLRCSSSPSFCSSVFGVSSRFFLGLLLNCYRLRCISVAQPLRRVRHGRRRARFELLSMQFVTPGDVPCRGDHSGTFTIAVGLTGGETSPVSAVVAVVSAEVRDDMWGQVVSDSVFQNRFFYFADLNE